MKDGELFLEQLPIKYWESVIVWKNSFDGTKADSYMDKNHFEVSISKNWEFKIADLNSLNPTKIEKVRGKSEVEVNNESIKFSEWPKNFSKFKV